MRSHWQRICLSAVMLVSLVSLSHAQTTSVAPEDEFSRRIRVSQDIEPLGATPFGEHIDLYSGSLSFTQTDIDLPGNGPDLQLTRSYTPAFGSVSNVNNDDVASVLGNWTLNVPRIETLSVPDPNQGGQWFFLDNAQRCSQFYPGQDVSVQQTPQSTPTDYRPEEWWHGYHMVTPDGGRQDLLKRSAQNTLSPSMSGMTFGIVTKQNWMIGCLAQTANGQLGQGFLAVAPDGTRYKFDWLVYKNMRRMVKGVGTPLQRRIVMMLVSQIQDRFGNTVNYEYNASGDLAHVHTSDGRDLVLQYANGLLSTATLTRASGAARQWGYTYTVGLGLSSVQLPDGTAWTFNFPTIAPMSQDMFDYTTGCQAIRKRTGNSYVLVAEHPSGLKATFNLTTILRGRSYTDGACNKSNPSHWKTISPDAYAVLSVQKKTFSGAGLRATGETWDFDYSPANESALEDCASGCVSTVWTDVTDPEGRANRHTFSNRFDATESLLLKSDYYSGAVGSSILRSEVNDYAPPTTGPWPTNFGTSFQSALNQGQTEQLSPLSQRTIFQDGDTYTWQAEGFDAYAQITKTKRSNSISGQSSIEESTTYRNDIALWVLGLPLQVTNDTKGEIESSNTYTANNDTLLTRSHFGQPLMSYAFNSAGQLASFKDGNNNVTTLGNYKRGIPQAIHYPDNTNQSLVVDDFGQIASITDQAGHTTGYSYDPVGRITGVTYPGGDEVAWYPTTFTYSFVTNAERGVPANHWKRTATTGNASAVTYFDALLRPVVSDTAISGSVKGSTLVNYDAKGQKVFASYPSATAITFTTSPTIAGSNSSYDALGRLTQVQQNSELGTLTSSTAYLSGARQQVTDPKGNVTTTSYQVFDSPSYNAVTKVQAPAGITQSIVRDLYGNPLSITQSGLYGTESNTVTKTLTYDSYHRLCRTTEPESRSTVMAYDSANNLAWSAQGLSITGAGCGQEQVTAAAKTSRTYDLMNRVTAILPPTGTQSTTYAYNVLGNMTSATSGISTWTGAYNYRGMLTGESLHLTAQNTWSIGYLHDGYGSVSQVNYPDGETVSYAPDALGRASKVGSYASGIGYFPNGQVKQFTYGNGTLYVAEQNDRQLLRNFTYGGSTPVLSEDLGYDENGNITTVTDLAQGPRNKTFGYDALNRIISATATGPTDLPTLWGTQTFTYDALNNLRTLTTGSQTSTYHYGPTTNQLASITSGSSTLNTYLYDTRGNVTGKNTATLAFDQKNQLTGIVGSTNYAYDASGRRVSKTVGGVASYYFYTQAGQLLYQWEPAKARTTNFVYLGSKMIGYDESVVLAAPATIGFDVNPNNGNYVVNWGAVPAATSYTLQESANGGGWVTVSSGSAANKTLSGRGGGSYTYRAQGCIGATCGAWTSSATLGVWPALPTVTVPGGTINGTYAVSWTAPASTTSYDVQERLNGGAWSTIASNTTATTISRPGTTSGSYIYQVAAKNSYGTRGWAGSSAVTVDTTYGVLPAVPAALSVPASSNNGGATLSWSSSALTTRYVVQQSTNGGASWAGIYNANGLNTALSGLADGSYNYQVQACNTYGCSAWKPGSATLVVTHPPTTAPTVAVPSSSANGSYTVTWSGVPGQVSYTLQEQINSGGWTTIQSNGTTSKAISGKGNGSYGYRVQACNVGGCGPWSTTHTIAVLHPPAAPASISIPATSSGSVAVNWAASSTAASYTLQHANYGVTGWSTIYSGSAVSRIQQEAVTGAWIYQVQACNGGGCSAFKVSSTGVTVTIPPASAPSLTVPASSNTGSYTVSWSGVAGASNYTLQEQVNSGGWSTVQTGSATTKAISGKGNGSYGYRAQASNVGGVGPWSSTKTITVALVPAVPSGVNVSDEVVGKYEQFTAHWNGVATATRYEVKRWQTGVTVYSGTATSYLLGSGRFPYLQPYTYQVRACNAAGCSAWTGTFG